MVAGSEKLDELEAIKTIKTEIKTACGSAHVMLDCCEDGKIQRVRIAFGKIGTCCNVMGESMAALITTGLQSGAELKDLVGCLSEDFHCHMDDTSCLARIAVFLNDYQ